MNNEFVFRFVPHFYNENLTMGQISETESKEIKDLDAFSERTFLNTFIMTADITGIRRFEAILDIIADELTETLEFRRIRLINKFSMIVPFTRLFLEKMLETIFGAGKWIFTIDHNNYAVFFDIETTIPMLFEQTMEDIRQIIPANLTIIAIVTIPYLHKYLNRNYTYEQMEPLTYGELSRYSTRERREI